MEVAVVLVGVAHLVRDDATEHVGRAARIVEERVRFVSEWKRRREPRHVLLALTEEHLDDVAHLADFVVLDEREPVTHRQKVLQPYGVTRVVGVGPFVHRRSCLGIEQAFVDERAEDHVQVRLGHRPRQQLTARVNGFGRAIEELLDAGVAFCEDFATLDHDDRVSDLKVLGDECLVNHLFESPREGVRARPTLGGPGHARGLGGEAGCDVWNIVHCPPGLVPLCHGSSHPVVRFRRWTMTSNPRNGTSTVPLARVRDEIPW